MNADTLADSQGWTLVENQHKARNIKGKNHVNSAYKDMLGDMHGARAKVNKNILHTASGPSVHIPKVGVVKSGPSTVGTNVVFCAVKPDKVVKGGRMVTVQRQGSRTAVKVTPPRSKKKRLRIASLENSPVDNSGTKSKPPLGDIETSSAVKEATQGDKEGTEVAILFPMGDAGKGGSHTLATT